MTATTKLEKQIVLKLFKEFAEDYNPSNISNELKKTRVGTFKALQTLEKDAIVNGKIFGKARFYKINLEDDYARKNVETLLMEETKPFQRWKEEFSEIFKYVDIVILFGSFIKNPKSAKDLDLLLVFDRKNNLKIDSFIRGKNEILPKKVHLIKQTGDDFISNLKKKDKVLLNALKEGVVLHGYDKLVEIIKDVTGRE